MNAAVNITETPINDPQLKREIDQAKLDLLATASLGMLDDALTRTERMQWGHVLGFSVDQPKAFDLMFATSYVLGRGVITESGGALGHAREEEE